MKERLGTDLTADPDWNANDDGWHGNRCNETDANRSTDQRSQLPEDLLLATPRLLAPECAAGRTATCQHPPTYQHQSHPLQHIAQPAVKQLHTLPISWT